MPAWVDRYRPGSFRGVPFVTEAHEYPFGQRGEGHEYPERDEPYFEALGRRADTWQLTVFVVGDDYMTGRDALLAALRQPGPGTLVHPYLGTFQAHFIDGRLTESTREGGMARFELHFVEPGSVLVATPAADTQSAAADAADATDADAAARFADEFDAIGVPPFVAAAAIARVAAISGVITQASLLTGGAGATLRAFNAGLTLLDGAAALVGAPANLAAVLIGNVAALGALGSRPLVQVAAVRQVIAAVSALPVVAPATPSRGKEAANAQAFADLVVCAAAGAAVRATATASFASYDDAISLRDTLGDDLDDQATAAADRGNGALAGDLDTLRRAMIADVTARGGSLARLFSYTPQQVAPALVIAWRLYRDPAELVDQAAELVARNRVVHPGFVPVAPLQVPTATLDV